MKERHKKDKHEGKGNSKESKESWVKNGPKK